MQIILIRHAKSSWENDFKDHDRPLSTRGINDAQMVFKEISLFLPNEYKIWCSTSKRTTQTSKLFCTLNNINFKLSLEFLESDFFRIIIKVSSERDYDSFSSKTNFKF